MADGSGAGPRGTPAGEEILTFGRTLAVAAVVGVAGGGGALAFAAASRGLQHLLVGPGDSFLEAVEALPWSSRLAVPALGAVVSALLLWLFLLFSTKGRWGESSSGSSSGGAPDSA